MSLRQHFSRLDWVGGMPGPLAEILTASEVAATPETEAVRIPVIGWARVFHLVRTYSMSLPFKRLANFMHFLMNLRSHFRLGACLREIGLAERCSVAPELHFKYLSNYLASGFSVRQRITCLDFHYRFIKEIRDIPFRKIMSGERKEIWARTYENKRYAVSFSSPAEAFREGDLALIFTSQGEHLYRLCFSFIPGRIVGIDEDAVILIGGSQGKRNTQGGIREAAKAFGEICPATVLLLQLMALAKSRGIRTIIATSVSAHTSTLVTNGDVNASLAYDSFWESNGGVRIGWFHKLASELVFRPSSAASSSHRARARRKQERKMHLFDEMLTRFGVRQLPKPAPVFPQPIRSDRKGETLRVPS